MAALLVAGAALASAQLPGTPVYSVTFGDAITGDNEFEDGGGTYWDIDPGADSYQNDFYERPTVQDYNEQDGKFAAKEYFEFLDIVSGSVGFDDTFLYVSIDLFGRDKVTNDGTHTEVGLLERYGFRFSANADGAFGYLFYADQPETNGTTFSPLKTFGFWDSNGDVGDSGLSVTKDDGDSVVDGFDEDIISDGELLGAGLNDPVLFSRIDADGDTVEFALNYTALDLTQQDLLDLLYFDMEAIKGGPKDPQNYLWNDKYTLDEAGSPYLLEDPDGLENIYELDTLRGGAPVPEPGTMIALGLGAAALLRRRAKAKR